MLVDEIFLSIQGEGTTSGLPTTFVRFYGCPVGCVYCDQPQRKENAKNMKVDEIVEEVRKLECKRVCITGGEPLIQTDINFVIDRLTRILLCEVSVETSGCFPLMDDHPNRLHSYVMDIKCPSSNVSEKNIMENLLKLHGSKKDQLKFVIANREDFNYSLAILKSNLVEKGVSVLFSPMFDKDNQKVIGKELVEWILEERLYNARIQIQLHKVLGVL